MPSRPLSDRQSLLSASGHAPSLHGRQQKSEGIVITGNKALNGGGAMYINNKVVNIKGKVNISGNTLTDTGATPSNVLLYTAENTCKLNVNGTLDTTTPIGVGIRKTNTTDTGFTPTCGVVTTGYGTNVSTTVFRSSPSSVKPIWRMTTRKFCSSLRKTH